MEENIKLTEKEKYALYQCDDGLGWKGFIVNKKLGISEKEAAKILKKLFDLGIITFDPYKDKDLILYENLKTKKEIEKFKKEKSPSFYPTKKGKKYVEYSPSWEE